MRAAAGRVEVRDRGKLRLSTVVQDKLELVQGCTGQAGACPARGAWDVIASRQRTPEVRERREMEAE